ncbi:MAG: carbohydrate binding domain-containing protein [Chitinispirillales bacterium]|jgi:hypothetical protein|nr:carbohydrate binding domain-containing protein [Chitinispirillales bacterium]
MCTRTNKDSLLAVLVIVSACFSADVDVNNLLVNPSFEEGGKGWNVWGGGVGAVARSGKAGLSIRNDEVKWSGADQVIALPEGAANVFVSGWIKTDSVVRGVEAWENARISIEFRDELGKLVGGYPPVAGQAVGTTGWTHFKRDYMVPGPARTVVLQCALGNAVGAAHFDDIALAIKNRKGELLGAGRLTGVTDEGEWYALPAKPGATGSHYVDWSGLLDAPAGKHGFLTVKNGGLFFEDGTPARFWGTNLVAMDCFAPDAKIDSAVARLAKMGCNMLRLHHMDAPWTTPNIFGNAKGTRGFSKESMRQLDYLISRCKERGIYIFLDFLVHRDFTEADGVENRPPDLGGKQVGFFSKKIIELQKEYNENLLNHVNQFTGAAYKDEPAIAASELINESTIFSAFSGDILTPRYREELEGLWEEWLKKGSKLTESDSTRASANKNLATFGLDWKDDRPRLKLKSPDGDVRESIRFLSELETNYFHDMRDRLRKAGCRYPLAGSNMPLPLLAMLKDNAELDIVCSNDYWDHPQVWKLGGDWDRILEAPFHNRSQLKNPKASVVQNKSYYRVDGKPFIITEWNHCYPNEYVLEGVPLIAAYGALQGWSGILQFDFNLHALGVDRILNYKLSVQPEDVAQWVMAAPLFLRGDVSAAPGLVVESISEAQYLGIPNYSETLEANYHLPFVTKVAKTFDGKPRGDVGQYSKYFDRDSNAIRSETGELMVNGKTGYMRIDAPRVQGASGFIGGALFDFPMFKCEVSNAHASIFIVSADGLDLISSKRFYIVATGPAKMKGQAYDPTRTQLENAGAGEVLTQAVNGKLTVKKAGGKKMQIFPLDIDGKRGKALSTKKSKGTLGILDLSRGRTLVYEAVVK